MGSAICRASSLFSDVLAMTLVVLAVMLCQRWCPRRRCQPDSATTSTISSERTRPSLSSGLTSSTSCDSCSCAPLFDGPQSVLTPSCQVTTNHCHFSRWGVQQIASPESACAVAGLSGVVAGLGGPLEGRCKPYRAGAVFIG